MLLQAAWAAVQHKGRLQARYQRLVRRMGGPKNPAARKKAIVAIAHTLLKIAYAILKTGKPARTSAPAATPRRQHLYLERLLRKLCPGCDVTITVTSAPDDSPPPRHAASPPDLARRQPA